MLEQLGVDGVTGAKVIDAAAPAPESDLKAKPASESDDDDVAASGSGSKKRGWRSWFGGKN